MKYEASEKTGGFGPKPLIRKGYYPARLTAIKENKDESGNWREAGKFGGRQIILDFEVWKADSEGNAVEKMTITEKNDGSADINREVILSQFLFAFNKDQKTGEYRTGFTPKSRITQVFMAMGWSGPPTSVDTDEYIGKWVELNVDDYENTQTGESFSVIKDVGKYKGAIPGQPSTAPPTPVKEVKEAEVVTNKEGKEAKLKELQEQKSKIQAMFDDKSISEEGYRMSMESIDTKIEEL